MIKSINFLPVSSQLPSHTMFFIYIIYFKDLSVAFTLHIEYQLNIPVPDHKMLAQVKIFSLFRLPESFTTRQDHESFRRLTLLGDCKVCSFLQFREPSILSLKRQEKMCIPTPSQKNELSETIAAPILLGTQVSKKKIDILMSRIYTYTLFNSEKFGNS